MNDNTIHQPQHKGHERCCAPHLPAIAKVRKTHLDRTVRLHRSLRPGKAPDGDRQLTRINFHVSHQLKFIINVRTNLNQFNRMPRARLLAASP